VTIVLGYLEDLEESPELKLVRRHLDDLLETSQEAHRIAEIWEQDRRHEFDLSELLAERVEAARDRFPDADVTLACDDAPAVSAHVALPMAIDELVENAVVHNDIGVEVTLGCTGTEDGVRISIADTGRGVPTEESDALFQERETALEHGDGLGLWLVYWTVVKSDGELEFHENEPSGTVVEVLLPEAR
jgi:two-component system sensor histidine kinase RegB